MLEKLKNLLVTARSTGARSEDIAKALEAARAEEAAAVARADEFGKAYAQGLLTLDDAKLQDLVVSRQAATIQRDRAQAVVNALEAKLHETREAEIVAVLTAEKDAAESEALAVASLIRSEYPKLANSLVSMLQRLSRADDRLVYVNRKLVAAGRRAEVMMDVQSRVLEINSPTTPFNIWSTVELREFPGFAPGWDCRDELHKGIM